MRKEAVDLLKKHLDSLSLEDWSVSKDACKEENITALWEIMQKFNPPVEVTYLLLEIINKFPEAKFLKIENGVIRRVTAKHIATQNDELYVGRYIQADCPLALQVLLKFNEEGELFDA